MLPQKNRLNKKEVEFVFKKGRTVKEGFLILKTTKEKIPYSSFSVIIPVKVSKKSTQRNKIKRKIRESLRKKLHTIKPGIKGLFIALPEIIDKNYKEIDDKIEKIIESAKIRKT